MNSLQSYIGTSAEGLLANRLANITEDLQAESRNIVEELKKRYRRYNTTLNGLLDLGITNSTDLQPNLEKVANPAEWANSIHDTVIEATLLEQHINVSVAVHNSLFPENKVEGLSKQLTSIVDLSTEE